MGGKKPDEYKGVAKFFTFLSQPEVQAAWHKRTGYLPITMAAYELTKKSGFYEKNPGTDVAVEQMILKTTDNSRGVRLGNFVQIRDDHRRGARSRSGPARRPPRRRSTTPSSAATSSSSSSRRPTRAERRTQDASGRDRCRRRYFRPPTPAARWKSASSSARRGCPTRWSRRRSRSRSSSSSGRRRRRCYSRCSCRTRSALSTEFVGLENFRAAVRRRRLPRRRSRSPRSSRVLVAGFGIVDLAAARGVRRPRRARRARLQDAADLALRGGAGGRRRAVAVPVHARRSASSPTGCSSAGHRLEPRCSTATRR